MSYYKKNLEAYKTIQSFGVEGLADVPEALEMTDGIVKAPSHYERYPEEPINFIMLNSMEFWRGNIVKYVARAGFKLYPNQDAVESEITDLRKVMRYSEMRINQLEGRKPNDDG